MPKPLNFLFGDQEYALSMHKVDRSKLYGSKEVEAVDDDEEVCELATLADDGRTMIGKGGTGLGWLDADGSWCDKSELTPHNVDGDPIDPVQSSFNASIKLFDTASADEYLSHNIRLVYSLSFDGPTEAPESAADLGDLIDELKRGTIFKFPYSYRGGLEADVGFLLLNDSDQLMFAVGNPVEFNFVGMQSQALLEQPEDGDQGDADLMDFDMI